ncbi:MAG: urease accessory protein UreD [Variibacter sp.]
MSSAAVAIPLGQNRATGRIVLAAHAVDGVTRRTRVYEGGSFRVRFPNVAGSACEAVLLNTAGGMAGGDRLDVALTAGAGAHLVFTSAAAEKIYRSLGEDSAVAVRIDASAGATLAWLPQETILFDQARLSRRIDIDLADDASLVMAEAVVFGRMAMGEAVHRGRLIDRWRIRRNGRLIFAETMRLDGAIATTLDLTAVTARATAVATLLLAPGTDVQVAQVRDLASDLGSEIGASAWNDIAVVRLCARSDAALRHDLAAILAALYPQSLPRVWLH